MKRKAPTATPKGSAPTTHPRTPTGANQTSADRMESFALAYHANAHATEAALAAGYSERTAASQGSRLLKSDKVRARLQELAAARASTLIATAEERQQFLTAVLRGEITDSAITMTGVISVPASLQNRLKAAEQLSKMQGSFVERRELTGKDGGAIQTDATNALPEEARAERLLSLLAKAGARAAGTDA